MLLHWRLTSCSVLCAGSTVKQYKIDVGGCLMLCQHVSHTVVTATPTIPRAARACADLRSNLTFSEIPRQPLQLRNGGLVSNRNYLVC
jgi:hypothetical protein